MDRSNGKFEKLGHTVYGGSHHNLPLWVHESEGLSDESGALLHAANIVGGSFGHFGDINGFRDYMGDYLISGEETGLTVADEFGKGSLNIGLETTTVNVHAVGSWEISTNLLFDMVSCWAEFSARDL